MGPFKMDHCGSYSALELSAQGGCALCIQFLQAFIETKTYRLHECIPRGKEFLMDGARTTTMSAHGILSLASYQSLPFTILRLSIPYSKGTSRSSARDDAKFD